MSNNDEFNKHFVCTYDEAREIIKENQQFFVSNCGCRESNGSCQRSRIDLCISFGLDVKVFGSNKRSIDAAKAQEIFNEATSLKLVTRPFRDDDDPDKIVGICFCCDDCCGLFQGDNEGCDQGKMVETTAIEDCIKCGKCVEYCYFKCREITGQEIIITRNHCFGCGICAEICPVKCIKMVTR